MNNNEVLSKEQLLENLYLTKGLLNEISSLRWEYSSYHRKPFRKYIRVFVIGIIVLFFFSKAIPPIIGDILLILLIAAPFGVAFYNKKAVKKKLITHEARILEIPKLIDSKFDLLEYSEVPSDYWNIYAVDSCIKYLTNNRADTIKECLNIYEQDMQHQERINELRVLQRQNEEISKQVESGNTIGLINLFTSVALINSDDSKYIKSSII